MDKEQIRWLMEQNEQFNEERRIMHQEAMAQNDHASDKYMKSIMFVMKVRASLELTIIILLAIIAFK